MRCQSNQAIMLGGVQKDQPRADALDPRLQPCIAAREYIGAAAEQIGFGLLDSAGLLAGHGMAADEPATPEMLGRGFGDCELCAACIGDQLSGPHVSVDPANSLDDSFNGLREINDIRG